MRHALAVLLCLTAPLVAPLVAQDTRTVTEPVIPPACVTLKANLTASKSGLTEADEQKLDTARIQNALYHCQPGQAVALTPDGANNAFLSGPIALRQGVTLLIEKGVILYASRDPKLYETSPGSCGIVSKDRGGCRPLIAVDNVSGAAIMGEGTIDGRGGSKLLGQNVTWWGLAEQARTPGSGGQKCPRLIVANHADNFALYRITLKNSPNFHVVYNHGDGFTVWGIRINTPKRLARNTDGIDPGAGSKNITITHSYIRTGDDNVAIKGSAGGVTNMTVAHNHFYWGHGMSIGSETYGGVSKLRVTDLSLDGPDSGIRIKSMGSRGGLVHDVVYDDICIRDSPRPLDLSAAYAANGPVEGNSPPTFEDITLHNVRVTGGGRILFNGYDHTHRVGVRLDGVLLTDAASAKYTYTINHADVTLGPGAVNLEIPEGSDSTITGKPSNGKPESCKDKFVPFPSD